MKYDFKEIESFWQKYWKEHQTFKTEENFKKYKYYILDMFPYPSGSGLHVGHILGYVSSDIYARYKRLEGFNVLHPMGFDSFGLPAEQYAIQTGKHPEKTTEINICQYKKQLSLLGFSFDWSRELKTSDPSYYRWTQWIFIKLFNSWYDQKMEKARQINELISIFEKEGNIYISETSKILFTNKEWAKFTSKSKEKILLNYRLAFRAKSIVNWCPYLGTVLANDEVKNGKSERGGYPVYQREMIQWRIRITAYAERLLKGLDNLLWPDYLKESQRNWIGKSYGVRINFPTIDGYNIEIFTTRPETIFGVSFIVLATEHRFIDKITNSELKNYIEKTKERNEKIISGVFTGYHALHPLTGDKLPIYVSDYVLGKYGTSAIMAVTALDKRDYQFAKKFGLKVLKVLEVKSGFLTGFTVEKAIKIAIEKIEVKKRGKSSINYRLRDSVFSRQRYWGEPIPIFYKEKEGEVLKSIPEEKLPLQLPYIDKFLPPDSGNTPLSSAKTWAWDEDQKKISNNESIDYKRTFPLETSTMPGWAGSSWYFLRFMDPNNEKEFVVKKYERYWKNVDLYVGGAEHATGHLLYARFLQKFLKDHGIVSAEEPFRKIINQGMILSRSAFVIRLKGTNKFISEGLIGHNKNIQKLAVDIRFLKENNILDIEKFKNWRKEFTTSDLILENGKFFCQRQLEKMSKSRYNVINPDTICEIYGADTLRMYEVFLGPIEQTKNWNLQGINGVHQFIKKIWKLYNGAFISLSKEPPSKEEYRVLHKTIKKVREDIENFSFNTSVSAFMIAVNFLSARRCCKRSVLEPLVILLSTFAPHIAEEIWKKLGHEKSISFAKLPKYDIKSLSEETIEYPILFNGKLRFKILLPREASTSEIKEKVLNNPKTKRYLNGKILKRIFLIHKKIINIVTKIN